MKNSALRCFVAMAVGRTDTDQVYDKHIFPTLKAAKIQSVFMGRLEHNDDIDKRIIQEIEACDFAIADLTYARPSVYFEAGFAQRKVPVIYTCRRDHLHPKADDEFGNLRVHFDLLMRNIIRWSSPGDRMFASKLARRVSLVTRPLLRVRQEEAAVKAEEREFERLPLASRLAVVSEKLRNTLLRTGYRPIVKDDRINPWVGRLRRHDTLSLCLLYAQPKFSQRDINSHTENLLAVFPSRFQNFANDDEYNSQQVRWQFSWPGYKPPKPDETKGATKLEARIILCSLEKIPSGRLTSALPRYTADEAGKVFRWDGELPVSFSSTGSGFLRLPIPVSVSVYMFDPIRSERELQARSLELRDILR